MIIPRFSIENNVQEYISGDDKINSYLDSLRAIKAGEAIVSISGQPLHIFNSQEQWHFDGCEIQLDSIVAIGRISLNKIPVGGHTDINPRYLSDEPFPIMQCFDRQDNEIIMGMLPILNFELSLIGAET